jgi:hypothetical protein
MDELALLQGARALAALEIDGTSVRRNFYDALKQYDIRAALEILTTKGIRFIDAPDMIHRHEDGTEVWIAFFKGSDSRPLAIMSQEKA